MISPVFSDFFLEGGEREVSKGVALRHVIGCSLELVVLMRTMIQTFVRELDVGTNSAS